ncbi:hypothetical protein MMC13_002273, partial [Lambiella insularis]|nr:hypothetical protein [Lambiella insularis]
MSSSTPRRSNDNSLSPQSYRSSNQFPFPQYDPTHRPSPSRLHSRRTSTASSITSVEGVLDAASQARGSSIIEAGDN